MSELPETCRHGISTDDPDGSACAFYEDSANLEPAGPARKRQRPALSSFVPVRFTPEMIADVKLLAAADGIASYDEWQRKAILEARAKDPGS